jgi:2-keto-4-pentenoate hydratase/2-oxohepta-3-ene-1,7-dioic acid hydratase in catechol pathway
MRLARIETARGEILWAEERQDRFYRLEGDPFNGIRAAGEEVRPAAFHPPVAPANIIALGLNYRGHAGETGFAVPAEPQFFLKATSSLVTDGQPIRLPEEAPDEVDYEAELGIVIGRETRAVSPEEAGQAILGYLCANDVSARDCQLRRDLQWVRGKSFDTFCPVGRSLVTDLDPRDLAIRCLLNGRVVQDSRTSRMIFDPFQTVSWLSRQMTLKPGTLILTGTPEGVGFKRTPPLFLKAGDRVVIEIEGIGRLENPVVRG